jgi:flagellar protein FlbD
MSSLSTRSATLHDHGNDTTMIILHSLKGEEFALNPGLIERVEGTAETHTLLVTGTSYVVQETVEEIVRLHREDRAYVQAAAGSHMVGGSIDAEPLHLPDPDGASPLRLVVPAPENPGGGAR